MNNEHKLVDTFTAFDDPEGFYMMLEEALPFPRSRFANGLEEYLTPEEVTEIRYMLDNAPPSDFALKPQPTWLIKFHEALDMKNVDYRQTSPSGFRDPLDFPPRFRIKVEE